jgi:hypothetical protein
MKRNRWKKNKRTRQNVGGGGWMERKKEEEKGR